MGTHDASSSTRGQAGTPRIAILGAGASGLCLAAYLKRAGFHSFTLYERADGVGGTWRDNSYPGAGCDVPSHFYSFSFEPKSDWSHKFSEQPEILAYLEHCARKYELYPHIRFRTELESARYDEASGTWRLRSTTGEHFEADVLVSGLGQLSRPLIPQLPGLEDFKGRSFHSARWDHGYGLEGRSVAVIGTGASAVQFIPRIAPLTRQLFVFQRSANWLIPRGDYAYSDMQKRLFQHVPGLQRLYRGFLFLRLEINFPMLQQDTWVHRFTRQLALRHLESQVPDPSLRQRLTPDYPVGCKRILIADDYYPALQRPNVELVTERIERVVPEGIVTADGRTRAVDTLIWGTGFETTSIVGPVRVEGRGGVSLGEAWKEGAQAHLGLAVSGFPNFFMLYGPNTNLGHHSILFMVECQSRYILRCCQELAQRRLRSLEVRPEAMARSNAELQARLARSVWVTGCTSWYKNESGKVTNNWGGTLVDYWRATREPRFEEYEAIAA